MNSSKREIFTPGTAVWIPDTENCWLKAVVKEVIPSQDKHKFTLKCSIDDLKSAQSQISIECDERQEWKVYQRNTTLNEDRLDDLTTLSYLTEPAVLSTIQTRYLENTIYTYSGLVLVSLNPYCDLSLYGESLIQAYSGKSRGELEPHLFAVAEDAFRSLQRDHRNQSIIISGESGAGKTISARWVMRYFAAVDSASSSKDSRAVEARVLASNPILEAFGNAKTTRNDNSSRFGKYVQIFFDPRHEITGAAIKTYLLEKTRVVTQSAGERNYHIFYQLLRGAGEQLREELFLKDGKFAYLQDGRIDGVDDAEEFKITQEALNTAGFSPASQNSIFRFLAAILHLGNVTFEADEDGNAQLAPHNEALQCACALLRADSTDMAKWMTKKLLVTKVETVEMKLNVAQAESSRDALSKFLYERVFSFIVRQLNGLLAPPSDARSKSSFIGVLDIYGFEKFDRNSFEQFCINYANEKLQHQFNLQVFKLEQELYEREEIEWSFINFADNQSCIDMIEARGGILDLLDEECRFPNGSDESFLAKLQTQIKNTDFFLQDKLQEPGTFTIRHFAYDVGYDCSGFLEKNRDSVPTDVISSLPQDDGFVTLPNPANTSKLSTGSGFRDSLRDLISIIQSTQVHYIRCIKPNCTKEALVFDPPFVLQQLRAGGIIETIKISAAGYPARWSFEEFTSRYGLLARDAVTGSDKEAARELLSGLTDLGPEHYQIGKSKIFLRAGILAELEKRRSNRLREAATLIQSCLRGIWIRKEVEAKIEAIKAIQSGLRRFLAIERLEHLRQESASSLICNAALALKARRFVASSLSAASLIKAQMRAHYIRENYTKALRRAMACRLQQAFRAYRLTAAQQATLHATRVIQRAWRRTVALRELKEAKAEAKSVAKLKEVSLGLEQKIVDLQGRIDRLTVENDQLKNEIEEERAVRGELDQLQEELESLQLDGRGKEQQLAALQSQLEAKDSELAAAKNELATLQSELMARDAEIERLQAEHRQQSSALSALQTAHDALKSELAAVSFTDHDSLEGWKTRYAQLAEEKQALVSQFKRLEHFVRQLVNKPSTAINAAGLASNTSLLNLVDAEVEAEAKLVHFPATEKANLESLLCAAEVERELLGLLQQGVTFIDPFLPARIVFAWLQLSLQFPLLHPLTEERVIGFLEAVRGELSQSADDRKCAFWMANLCQLYGFVHHEICEKERQFKELSKHLVKPITEGSPAISQISLSELAPPMLLLLRAELLRLIGDIYAAWLRELCRFFGRAGLAAILDHQSLANYRVPQKRPSERFFAAVLSSLVDGAAGSNPNDKEEGAVEEMSVHDLLAALDDFISAITSVNIPSAIHSGLLSTMFEHMSVTCFNQFMLRRGFISWKRAIQVQYNLSRFEEWYRSGVVADEIEDSIPFKELLQAVKVVQLAKTRGIDATVLQQCAPSLSPAQIRRLLTNYVPDDYEDGPVPVTLIRQLDSSTSSGSITLKTVDAGKLTVEQECLGEVEAGKFVLTTEVPSTLWKLFLLNEE